MSRNGLVYDFDFSDVFLYILAFIVPPVPVLIRYGFFTNQFLLNVLLTLLFGLPGTVHSVFLVYRSSEYYQRTYGDSDYERIADSEPVPTSVEPPTNYSDNANNNHPNNDKGESSSSAPKLPTYEESEGSFQTPTDNKVQR